MIGLFKLLICYYLATSVNFDCYVGLKIKVDQNVWKNAHILIIENRNYHCIY
jgi:hypothetical protein